MSDVAEFAPGSFCWVELGTTDQQAAKHFYGELFGWIANDIPIGPEVYYTMLQLGGRDVAALYPLGEDQIAQGLPPQWIVYMAVSSTDEAVLQVRSLGGTVLAEPFDVMDVGRMAMIQDPTGGVFALWEARSHPGVGVMDEPGAVTWLELTTADPERARTFYSGLFGWEAELQPIGGAEYTTFSMQGRPVAGMMLPPEELGGGPPLWTVYFAVEDCDRSAERTRELGGEIRVPPTDVPGIGRFAALEDPQGAGFSIIRMEQAG